MRIPSYRDRQAEGRESSMTAMIDLVFLLLIFFMCASAGQIGELLVPTTLSGGAVESNLVQPEEQPLGEVWLFLRQNDAGQTEVQLNKGGTIFRSDPQGLFRRADGEGNTLSEVLRQLAQAEADIPVILDIQPDVPMGAVLKVRVAVLNARLRNVKFALQEQQH